MKTLAVILLSATMCFAQEKVGPRSYTSGSHDFSSSGTTIPCRTGTGSPNARDACTKAGVTPSGSTFTDTAGFGAYEAHVYQIADGGVTPSRFTGTITGIVK